MHKIKKDWKQKIRKKKDFVSRTMGAKFKVQMGPRRIPLVCAVNSANIFLIQLRYGLKRRSALKKRF